MDIIGRRNGIALGLALGVAGSGLVIVAVNQDVLFLMLIGIGVYSYGRLVLDQEWPAGFATTTVLIMTGIILNALFLGIIGGLTLLIGGIGVANIMYAVVKQRTHAIGCPTDPNHLRRVSYNGPVR